MSFLASNLNFIENEQFNSLLVLPDFNPEKRNSPHLGMPTLGEWNHHFSPATSWRLIHHIDQLGRVGNSLGLAQRPKIGIRGLAPRSIQSVYVILTIEPIKRLMHDFRAAS
jgi:hypothetical protein